jgi:hypothetical protein
MGSTVSRVDLSEIDLEQPPSHCFSTTCGSGFDVRHGPNYAKFVSVAGHHHRRPLIIACCEQNRCEGQVAEKFARDARSRRFSHASQV